MDTCGSRISACVCACVCDVGTKDTHTVRDAAERSDHSLGTAKVKGAKRDERQHEQERGTVAPYIETGKREV